MAVLPLVTVASLAGRKRLRTPTEKVPIERIPKLSTLVAEMIDTMHAANGIGLASVQVGRSERVAVIAHADGDLGIINPRIVRRSLLRERGEEGCLSIPKVFGDVNRSRSVTVEYWTLTGEKVRRTARGLLARVFQHEIDHLDGVLFIDRTRRITQGEIPPEARAPRPAVR